MKVHTYLTICSLAEPHEQAYMNHCISSMREWTCRTFSPATEGSSKSNERSKSVDEIFTTCVTGHPN